MDDTRRIRAIFFRELLHGIRLVWPVASGLIALMVLLGIAVSYTEGWKFLDGIYFAFVTGLTVGYGDLVPVRIISRIAAIAIGFIGILLTALLAASSVFAFQRATAAEEIPGKNPAQEEGPDKS
jgi:uncharacterized membrane protein